MIEVPWSCHGLKFVNSYGFWKFEEDLIYIMFTAFWLSDEINLIVQDYKLYNYLLLSDSEAAIYIYMYLFYGLKLSYTSILDYDQCSQTWLAANL